MQARASAIIAAGGQGERLSFRTPKQYLKLGGLPLLAWSAGAIAGSGLVTEVIVGAAPADLGAARRALGEIKSKVPLRVVGGGRTRQETVRNCLAAADEKAGLILIHDAARPFVSRDLIERTLMAAKKHDAATAALRPADTIKLADDKSGRRENLDRDRLWLIQTPQAFSASLIWEAHERARREGWIANDDTALVERMGVHAAMAPGDPLNFKITAPADLKLARAVVKSGMVKPTGRKKRDR